MTSYAVFYTPKEDDSVANDCLECDPFFFHICFPEQQLTAHTQIIIINKGVQHLNHRNSEASTAHMG